MITVHLTLTPNFTAEQLAWLAAREARGEPPWEASASDYRVRINADGSLDIEIPDEMQAALAASAPGWIQGQIKAGG